MSEDDQGDPCGERITEVIEARNEQENQLEAFLETSQNNVYKLKLELKKLQAVYQDVTKDNSHLRSDIFALHANMKYIRENMENYYVAEDLMESNLKLTELKEMLVSSIDDQKTSDANEATIKKQLMTTQDNLATTFKTLETTKANLETTKDNLETTKANLETTKDNLETTKANLETTKDNLETTKDELLTSQNDVENQTEELVT
jgi:myosin protein heavy chain